jgi:TolB-like protein/Tfp pilus assembly protein PilF/predicted Ser/Thr protein kinase
MIGQTISHYKITAKLGAGGMGEVYLAKDLDLGRKVAVKFLAATKSEDEESRQRFIHEARAQAMLNHPNVATFFEVGESDGRAFIVMEYIEGKPLPEVVRSDSLSLSEILRLVIQVAEGLQAAHEKGIIHRDIKPENIMVTPKGLVKITDFGLARWKGATTLTQSGTRMGTVSYMSPEQAEGKKVDHRSDIFSLGVVLYELVAGRPPFEGEHEAAITYSIVNETPQPLARYEAKVSDKVEQIVSKCLAKRREERYQSCADLVADLRMEQRTSEPSPITIPRRQRSRGLAVSLVIVAVIAIVALVFKPWQIVVRNTEEAVAGRKMLAVLPFENLGSEEQEYFADGITEEITTHVAKISGMGVISRTSAIRYKGTNKSLPEIGKELGVEYVLEGTIRWDDSGPQRRVRINPQLIRVKDDTHVWTETYDRVPEEIFAVQTDIAEQVAAALDVTLLQPERDLVASQPTDNIQAYNYYLRGLQFPSFPAENLDSAGTMFRNAIELDSGFALAYARLSMVYSKMYWWYFDHTPERAQEAKAVVEKALAMAPDLPEAHMAMASYFYRVAEDNDRALSELSLALAGKPNDGEALQQRAHILHRQGHHLEALRDMQRAVTLVPQDPTVVVDLANINIVLRRYDQAEILFDRAGAMGIDLARVDLSRGFYYLTARVNLDSARSTAEEAIRLAGSSSFPRFLLVMVDYMSGDLENGLRGLNTPDGKPVTGTGDSTDYYLFKGMIYECMGDSTTARACADSARIIIQRTLSGSLSKWDEAEARGQLARAFVILGRADEAVSEAERSVALLPATVDALDGWDLAYGLAAIYTAVGQYDHAIDALQDLLSHPNWFSADYIRIAPQFAALHDLPRFQELMKKGHTVF